MNEQREQPTREEKIAALSGKQNGWDFTFSAPPVPTAYWNVQDWINYIGDRWFKTNTESVAHYNTKLMAPYPFCRTPERCTKAHRCLAEICCAD